MPQGGFGEPRSNGRRRTLVIGGVVLALFVVWSYIILSHGGEDRARNESPDERPEPAGETTKPTAVPSEPAYAEDTDLGGDAGATSEPAGGPTTEASPSEPSPKAGQHPTDRPEGAADAGSTYDPLGTGAGEGDLAPTDEKRLSFAAVRYVTAAYGYSGNDREAYNQGVQYTVVLPGFFDSEGSSEIKRYGTQVAERGTKSAAVLTRFEPLEVSAERAVGDAYFKTGDAYAADGGLVGKQRAYRQKMILTRNGVVWKVTAVNNVEDTS